MKFHILMTCLFVALTAASDSVPPIPTTDLPAATDVPPIPSTGVPTTLPTDAPIPTQAPVAEACQNCFEKARKSGKH